MIITISARSCVLRHLHPARQGQEWGLSHLLSSQIHVFCSLTEHQTCKMNGAFVCVWECPSE